MARHQGKPYYFTRRWNYPDQRIQQQHKQRHTDDYYSKATGANAVPLGRRRISGRSALGLLGPHPFGKTLRYAYNNVNHMLATEFFSKKQTLKRDTPSCHAPSDIPSRLQPLQAAPVVSQRERAHKLIMQHGSSDMQSNVRGGTISTIVMTSDQRRRPYDNSSQPTLQIPTSAPLTTQGRDITPNLCRSIKTQKNYSTSGQPGLGKDIPRFNYSKSTRHTFPYWYHRKEDCRNPIKCFLCRGFGHRARSCSERLQPSSAQEIEPTTIAIQRQQTTT